MSKIVTVLGDIDPGCLGKTTIHDHVFIDLSNQFREPEEVTRKAIINDELTLQNTGMIRRNPWAIKGNLIVNNMEVAIRELQLFKMSGGNTIVDVTNIGLGRDPLALAAVSRLVGVNIICGAGYYYEATHPSNMDEKTPEMICEEIVRDLEVGIDTTGIRAGVIGEIGVSEIIKPSEEKVLAGVGMAQKNTGAGVEIHIFPWKMPGHDYVFGLKALDILEENGADVSKIAINHVDVARKIDINYILAILKRGTYVTFDNFGHDFPIPRASRQFIPGVFATDWERVEAIIELIEQGYGRQIMIANDICHKSLLVEYGGWGYAHVIVNAADMLLDKGASEAEVEDLLVNNPARFLAF